MTTHSLKFRLSGKLARLLGRDSVSSDTAALFELVKNGYDADASRVTVKFENMVANDGRHARITVEDSGDGMTRDDIVDKWMVVGTDSKDRMTVTRGGRTVLGNKGVGRFATEKIARRVTVVSWPRESSVEIKLKIDWTKFEDEGVQFSDVEVPIEITPRRTEPNRHGLRIVLEDIRERWDANKIRRLKASVSSIVLPEELQGSDDGFGVVIYADEFDAEDHRRVESLLFKEAPYSLSAILPDQREKTTVYIKKKGSLVDSRSVQCGDMEMDGGDKWRPFGGCDVHVYIYPQDTKYERWSESYGVLKYSYVRKMVHENYGLKIYRDGFWVSPYGGPGNDWMGLEAARVQSNLRVGNTQIIGFVKITKAKNKEIRDTTSRERLEENTAFMSLKYFIGRVFDEFFDFRKNEVKVRKEQNPRIHGQAIRSALKDVESMVQENPEIDTATKKNIGRSLKRLKSVIESYRKQSVSDYDELVAQQRMYRSLAALGISSVASYHEIFNIVADMGETPQAMKTRLTSCRVEDSTLYDFIDTLRKKIDMIARYTWFIRKFVQGVGSAAEKPEKEKLHLKREMESLWEDYVRLADVSVSLTVRCYPDDLAMNMNRADFLSLVLNMLTNSLKALDKQDPRNKKIRITASRTATNLEITFSDNGTGVDEAIREKIFRPLFSTYANGTGMGLAIVSEVLENYGGRIEHRAVGEFSNGATFVLQIPWVDVRDE